ncbi:MAG TPA: serine/threonine-protein kinase [Gaiella sp.]|jgi:serine/threonine-protein kinase|nr:serine/threonine-protein kinase [Gaiella sp.]
MSSTTRIGTTVAGYRLEKLLGRGGMSVVYLAEHVRLGRKVALKLLSPALSEDESFRERFERESRRAAEIDHPNIVPIYDAGDADGQFFIAMRFVHGFDLKTLIKRDGALNVGRTLYILEQAASALDAAHERDLVHRDVKPANILIEEPSDRVFLTDFGVVKHTASHGLTRTGFFIGTVDYAAPEQIEGLPVDARTDVYALGCVLYECLSGRVPFDRDAEVAAMHAHLTEPPPSLRSARPDLPRELDRVIVAAMAKAKDDRQSTCEELIQAAHAAALGRGTSIAIPAAGMAGATAGPPEVVEPEVPGPGEPEGSEQEDSAVAELTNSGVAADGEPPAPAAGNGTGVRSRLPGWLLVAIVAVGAAAVSGIAVYLATASDPKPPDRPEPIVTDTVVTPDTGLEQLVEPTLFRSCTVDATPRFGASESATCGRPSDLPAGRFYPESVDLAAFDSETALNAAYDEQKQNLGIGRDYGTCTGRAWNGEGEWVHTDGKPAGRRFCQQAGNVFVIVWTHNKLGQPTHKDFLGIARGLDHPRLFNWWDFWHHTAVGRLRS